MQQLIFSLTLLYAIFSLNVTHAPAVTTAIVTGNPEAPPIVWEKQGKLIGMAPQIVTEILTGLKVPFIIKPAGTWQQVQDKAKNGTVDMIVSAYDNKERRTYMEYSEPYLDCPVVIVVKKGDSFLCNCWTDLLDKKGVANTGESFGDSFDAYIKEKLAVTYTTYNRAFEMLAEDTADYLIIDLFPALIYSKLLLVEDKIEFMERPVTIQQFHITISKQSPHVKLLPQINARIAEMKKQGAFKKLASEQYKNWTKTFEQRQRFYAKSQVKAKQEQTAYNAGARDRGLDNMARFMDRDIRYMEGGNW
ncbi:MAG: transporter substrate-binding domain-containing protein [Desulfobulbaceae bacterium]|nr:transporter substrate-binding domain-containing protein [Desulfobulbaceae bacterium]